MKPYSHTEMLETSASISRQYIDAVSVFEALEESMKRRRDALQADTVQELLEKYLPQLSDN